MTIRTMVRSHLRGFSWKNPMVNAGLKAADPIDFMARLMHQRTYLPSFSIRVRSAGIKRDFGAARFQEGGRKTTALLRSHAKLTTESKVLEIGCGCGTTAFGLAEVLKDGNYTGMDIERVSLSSAGKNARLKRKGFHFDFLDIRNGGYNPEGKYLAAEYVFPYPDASFDIVFFTSVFTHMLTAEVQNYARQIARVLKPGGCSFLTAYLLEREMKIEFPYTSEEHSYMNREIPEVAVAYRLPFLVETFAAKGMRLTAGPLWGTVHGAGSETGMAQDIMVFTK